MSSCKEITNAAFVHLRGIHTLDMTNCTHLHAALVHIVGIRKLDIAGCPKLTDAALAPLKARGAIIRGEGEKAQCPIQ